MKKLQNPYIGVEGYNCFGCSPTNPMGVHMHFMEDGDDIVCHWSPTQNHQSWIDTLHGGVQCVLLDEICGWAIFRKLQTAGVTAQMETRYRKAVRTTDGDITLRARIKEQRRNLVTVEGELYDAAGELCTTCTCLYFAFSREKSEKEFHFQRCLAEGEEDTI